MKMAKSVIKAIGTDRKPTTYCTKSRVVSNYNNFKSTEMNKKTDRLIRGMIKISLFSVGVGMSYYPFSSFMWARD